MRKPTKKVEIELKIAPAAMQEQELIDLLQLGENGEKEEAKKFLKQNFNYATAKLQELSNPVQERQSGKDTNIHDTNKPDGQWDGIVTDHRTI